MASLATPSDLASWLQKDLDTATATLALAVASQRIRDHVGWSITQELAKVFTLDGPSFCESLWLPTRYVTAVNSVVENGVILAVVTGYDWTTYGRLIRVNRPWYYRPRSIVVNVDHGYAASAAELDTAKGVCLSAAGRIYENPNALRSFTVGGVSEVYSIPSTGDSGRTALTETEMDALSTYRLPTVG